MDHIKSSLLTRLAVFANMFAMKFVKELKRTDYCGNLNSQKAGQKVVLMGWVNGTISTIPDLKAHGIPTIEEAVEHYCAITGRSGIKDLNWFFAYNAFRLVGILQGILGRVRDGTANHPDAANMAPRVLGLAEMSWAYAKKAGAS